MYNLGGILALKDKNFASTMKKSSKNVDSFKNQIRHTNNQMLAFERQASASFSRVAKSAIGFGVAYLGISSVTSTIKDWTSAANVQIEAETRLENMMMNVKGTTMDQVDSMKKYAGELQKVGVVGDEVGMRGMAQLATFNLQTDSIKTLSTGMYDLAVNQHGVKVSGEQMQGIANVIGKAMEGNAGVLTRYGVTMTDAQKQQLKFGNQAQRAAVISAVLATNVGGVNAALAKTPEGAQVQAMNNWGDVREELGKRLLPKMVEFYGWFQTKMPAIQSIMETSLDKGVLLFDKMGRGIDLVRRNAGWLVPVVGGLVGAMVALKVINTVNGLMAVWRASTILQTLATTGLNAVLMANPLTLIVIGIGLVVAAGIALYRNWDTVKKKASEMWDHISGIGQKIKDFFKNPFGKGGGSVQINATSTIASDGMSGFATGINRVPHDMVARIHKDEAVIPAKDNLYNPNARAAGRGQAQVVVNINGYNKSTKEIMNEFVPELKLVMANI